jgi:hypothetical protein
MAKPREEREEILSKVVVDMPGCDFEIPKPLFHTDYGLPMEVLVQKAVSILKELNREQMELTPIMATAIRVTAPELFRLISVVKDDVGEPYQITDAAKFLIDHLDENGQLALAIEKYGQQVPGAAYYLKNEIMKPLAPASKESRIGALLTALRVIETEHLRAMYGFSRPGITYREIIDRGLIYLVSGEKLGDLDEAQAWIFWNEFASLRAVINQRIPDDDREKPVLLIIDEVYRLFEIKGMAKALGQISTYFRSRKLMPVIILQAFWQLDKLLQEQYWNLGNLMTFQMDNFNDAYKLAQQLFPYSARETKYDAPSDRSNPLAKTDREQYLEEANWIQRLGKRRVLMRRYIDEQNKEDFVAFVNKTKDVKLADMSAKEIYDLKI